METGLLGATGADAQQLAVTVQCTGGARATTPRLRMVGNHARVRDMNQPNVEWRHAHVSLKFCCILFKNSRKALEFKRPCQACRLGDYCLSFSRRDIEWCCTSALLFNRNFGVLFPYSAVQGRIKTKDDDLQPLLTVTVIAHKFEFAQEYCPNYV